MNLLRGMMRGLVIFMAGWMENLFDFSGASLKTFTIRHGSTSDSLG